MGQHVHLRLPPRHDLAVEPDVAVTVVVGNQLRHGRCLAREATLGDRRNRGLRSLSPPLICVNQRRSRPPRTVAHGHHPTHCSCARKSSTAGWTCCTSPSHQLNLDAAPLRAQGAIDETDHQTLFLIERQPGITLAELCAVLGISKQTLSRHLRRLAGDGLIEQGSHGAGPAQAAAAADGQGGRPAGRDQGAAEAAAAPGLQECRRHGGRGLPARAARACGRAAARAAAAPDGG